MELTSAQRDRAYGVLLATAAGDALGAPFEFGGTLGPDTKVAIDDEVSRRSIWETGEWTDDTSMAVAIAEVAATGADLRDEAAQDAIVRRWHQWAHDPGTKDVGIQTRRVLAAAGRRGLSAAAAREASAAMHQETGRSAGNGSLMRTAPVALAYLDDEKGLVEAARAISALTHHDPDNADACVLWCCAIRHAIMTGELDVRIGLDHLDPGQRARWSALLDAAEQSRPSDFTNNGWVVEALQAAWSAIATTPVPQEDPAAKVFRADHLRLALEAAVRGGRDTDTVAAIAGGLLGAVHGASAVPAQWRRRLHGWPGWKARGLVGIAAAITRGGKPDTFDYGYVTISGEGPLAKHPHDDGVWVAGVRALQSLPDDVGAVVSLCQVGDFDLPTTAEHLDVRLIDRPGANPNLDFVLHDTVRAIEQFRAEGKTVLLHCVQAVSRTPSIAALYGARRKGITIDQALEEIAHVLPQAWPRDEFRRALQRLHPGPDSS
ncbi:ADP-ribosylglycohydrolase family protein [Mycobacterium shimoidei]|uniref:ADP-ribosylglycohydrolase family protein n=1 Tax=Mycobacterium shimoidei TaxID=29313 RepID=UPI0008491DAD|nr:ADP-ribosylglycohydrolase family protein [Mycobacterium shimoidei]MCV7260878.1 ADP-ribosylglycohydrolase family protein [Mycobacterium shimoidei]ODR05590.1 ribosylglycohydrolase [Mycobacterium shimoidei]ORW78452.1 ribosylglycohydrolase [Mycobacterium shimoidei]